MEFVQEKVSGKVSWKQRKIGPLLQELSKGDIILLSEFSRLGRSMLECMEIISVALHKEIERELISKRTQEALLIRKQAGVTLGRPKGPGKSKLDMYRVEIEALLNNGSRQKLLPGACHSSLVGKRHPSPNSVHPSCAECHVYKRPYCLHTVRTNKLSAAK